ncbi:MAG TPA: helix-turn-helix domain-containing protein [Candidatus Methylomirabilis sp.]|nr:helix-turn-helix domain-containing protein [Candidatus Methylomirabilis sp.]
MKKAECSNCGSESRIVRGDYEFKETGLRDLVLRDIELVKCPKCGNVDPILPQVDQLMHVAAVAILQKPYRLQGEELRFLRKHIELSQEEFAKLLRVNKTTLSKWENNEDPIGVQSDLLARAIVISRDKRLEKRAADHIRAFAKIADKQKHLRVEVDAEKLEYEYA